MLSVGTGLGLAVSSQTGAQAALVGPMPAVGPLLAANATSVSRQFSVPVEKPLLQYGMRGPHVKLLQRKLAVKPRSGYFGKRTLKAVRKFQTRNGLVPDGVVGKRTWKALGYSGGGKTKGAVRNPMRLGSYRLSGLYLASGGPWTGRRHQGLDFAAPRGTRVSAAATGQVEQASWAGGCGYRVVLRHADGTKTWYCHLDQISVWSGTVQVGQKVGTVGATGHATGNHLHFEVRKNHGATNVNPLTWLRNNGVAL